MSREELREASELIERAADTTDDENLRGRLADQADQLAALADRERGPDHGRLDRHQQALRNIKADAGGALDEPIDAANERITAHRETLEGV